MVAATIRLRLVLLKVCHFLQSVAFVTMITWRGYWSHSSECTSVEICVPSELKLTSFSIGLWLTSTRVNILLRLSTCTPMNLRKVIFFICTILTMTAATMLETIRTSTCIPLFLIQSYREKVDEHHPGIRSPHYSDLHVHLVHLSQQKYPQRGPLSMQIPSTCTPNKPDRYCLLFSWYVSQECSLASALHQFWGKVASYE